MKAWQFLAAVGAAMLLAARPATAQVLYGQVVVDVRDNSGGVVPGADVTIVQTETNWSRSATSSDTGLTTFATVPPGTFTVTVSLSGFKEYVANGVVVSQNNVTRLTTTLVVGAVTD